MPTSTLGPIATIAPVAPTAPAAPPSSSSQGNPAPADGERSFARALDRAANERKQGDKARTEGNARHGDPSRPAGTKPAPAEPGQVEPVAVVEAGDAADGMPPVVDPALGPVVEPAAPTRGPVTAPTPATAPVPGPVVLQGQPAANAALLDPGTHAAAVKSTQGAETKPPTGVPAPKTVEPNLAGAEALAQGAAKAPATALDLPAAGMAADAPRHAAEGPSPGQAPSGSAPLPTTGGATAAASAQPSALTSPSTPSSPAEIPFHARPDQAGFQGALGAQLSILARNGVTEARLHLNPAELGPVWVQISVNGQAARVDMAAEHMLTRQALEQSMPALASALRESGLTLTGGGVFEQPGRPGEQSGQGGHPTGRRGAGIGAGAEGEPEPVALPTPVARGMVDLYA